MMPRTSLGFTWGLPRLPTPLCSAPTHDRLTPQVERDIRKKQGSSLDQAAAVYGNSSLACGMP